MTYEGFKNPLSHNDLSAGSILAALAGTALERKSAQKAHSRWNMPTTGSETQPAVA
jgi:hypothetical protein